MRFTRKTSAGDVTIELTPEELEIGPDLHTEASKVAARIGVVAELLSVAVADRDATEAAYRYWRAKRSLAIQAEQSKLSEWKLKDAVEADDGFLPQKKALASAEGRLEALRGYMAAFREKSRQIDGLIRSGRQQEEAEGRKSHRVPVRGETVL